MIKTSELSKFLGNGDWEVFFNSHETELEKFLSRQDGAAVSSDIDVSFDSNDSVVSAQQISIIRSEVLGKKISLDEIYFLFNLIALSGFDFDSEAIEDAVMHLSTPNAFGSFKEVAEILGEFGG